MEEAKHYALMRDEYGYSAQKLADRYNDSKSNVSRYWMIATLPESVPTLGQLSESHLYELSKLVDKDKLVKVFEDAFSKKFADWDDSQRKKYEDELKSRQEVQIKLANVIPVQELTVKQTEREVKNYLYQFEERDEQIKLSEKEKARNALKKLDEHLSYTSQCIVNFNDNIKKFTNVMGFFSPDILKLIPKEEGRTMLSRVESITEELDNLNIKEIRSDLEWFKEQWELLN
jgi:hypothetical protein